MIFGLGSPKLKVSEDALYFVSIFEISITETPDLCVLFVCVLLFRMLPSAFY